VHVRSSAAVRVPAGLIFGTLHWVEPAALMIEVDAEISVGETVDVRIDLSPHGGTALLEGCCRRVVPTAAGEVGRFVLGIQRMSEDDRRRFTTWLRQTSAGGTLSDFSLLSVASYADHGTMRQVAPSEQRQAMQRIDEKLARSDPGARPARDPFSGASSSLTENQAARAGLRNALRRAIAGESRAAGAPPPRPTEAGRPGSSVPPGSPPRTSVPPGPPPRTGTSVPPGSPPRLGTSVPPGPPPRPTPAAASGPGLAAALPGGTSAQALATAAANDRRVVVSRIRDVVYIEVAWTSAEAFRFDWHQHLSLGRVELRAAGDYPSLPPVTGVLRFGSLILQIPMVPVQSHPGRARFNVEFSPGQVEELKRAARPFTVPPA
jgi:hypothetical protein